MLECTDRHMKIRKKINDKQIKSIKLVLDAHQRVDLIELSWHFFL